MLKNHDQLQLMMSDLWISNIYPLSVDYLQAVEIIIKECQLSSMSVDCHQQVLIVINER